MKPLTQRQDSILRFIHHFRQDHGCSPSIREIGEHFGIRSLRGVTVNLDALQRKGYIHRDNPRRSINLTDDVYEALGGSLLDDAISALEAEEAAHSHRASCAVCRSGRRCEALPGLLEEARSRRQQVLSRPRPTDLGDPPDETWQAMKKAVQEKHTPRYVKPNYPMQRRKIDSDELTPTEIRVLNLLAEGNSAREVALKQGISKRTVDFHTVNIFRRLGVDNRVRAINTARARGILQPDLSSGSHASSMSGGQQR